MQKYGRTDMTKTKSAFRYYAKLPKKRERRRFWTKSWRTLPEFILHFLAFSLWMCLCDLMLSFKKLEDAQK